MKLLLLLLATSISFASCTDECTGKQVTCPAFKDDVSLQWIPYTLHQQLIFSSAAGNDTFDIAETYFSPAVQETVSGRNPYCEANAYFKTGFGSFGSEKKSAFNINLTVDHDAFSNQERFLTSIGIKATYFFGNGFSDTGLTIVPTGIINSPENLSSHFYPTTTIGNKRFNDLQKVEKDTAIASFSDGAPYKFWIAKNIGIVAYEEYHGNLWVKQ